MPYLAKYGVEFTLPPIPIPKKDDTDFAATGDWTPVSGDVKISKDAGNVVNIAALPTAVGGSGSVLWKFVLSVTEMQAKTISIQIVDAALEDQVITVQTYGHASAQIIGDWNTVGDWKATGYSTHDAAGVWSASGRALTTPSDYKADVSGLSTHSAANVWTAGSRALSTPSDYKADVSGLSTHNAAAVWLAGSRALSTPSDYMATGFSTHDAADVKTAMEVNGTKLDHLWEMTVDNAGTRRLTAAALALAPSGGLSASEMRTALGMASANLDTQLNLKATVNALSGLITTVGTAGAGLSDLGGMSTTMKAQIRTQAVAALATDTYDELAAVPADDSSIKDKIEWLFMRSIHEGTESSSERTLKNAASDAEVGTAAISDDGSTFTREKWTS